MAAWTSTAKPALEAVDHMVVCQAFICQCLSLAALSILGNCADNVHQMYCRVAPRGRENPSAPAVEIPAFLRKRRTRGK